MPLPNLINSSAIVLQLIQKTQTRYSNRARSVKGRTVYSDNYSMSCQPFLGKVEDPEANQAGIEEIVEGYIVVRTIDMDSILPRYLKRGDKIVAFGSGSNIYNVEFFIVGSKLGGAYNSELGFTLRKYYFANRIIESPGGDL